MVANKSALYLFATKSAARRKIFICRKNNRNEIRVRNTYAVKYRGTAQIFKNLGYSHEHKWYCRVELFAIPYMDLSITYSCHYLFSKGRPFPLDANAQRILNCLLDEVWVRPAEFGHCFGVIERLQIHYLRYTSITNTINYINLQINNNCFVYCSC